MDLVGLIRVLGFLVLAAVGIHVSGSAIEEHVQRQPEPVPDSEANDEADEIAQMLAAQNEFRRRSGRPERTEQQVIAEVEAEQRWLEDRVRSSR
jgi:hypothetical protein